MKSDEMILALYTIMFAFVVYMSYKTFTIRKDIKGEQITFNQKPKILQYILVGLLLAMIFMVQGIYLKIILLGISTYFVYNSTEKISFSEHGIYHNGRLEAWDDIKQWQFDDKKDTLIVHTSKKKPNNVRIYPTRKEDKDEINKTIRKFKQKKNRKK